MPLPLPGLMLGMGRGLPRVPTPVKLYYDSVIEGKKDPITEADFTPEELAAIQQLTTAAPREEISKVQNRQKTLLGASVGLPPLPSTPNTVSYETYQKPSADVPEQQLSRHLPQGMGRGLPNGVGAAIGPMGLLSPQGRVTNSLGQFNYAHNSDGSTTVTDNYDFNNYGYQKRWDESSLPMKALQAIGSLGYIPARVHGETALPDGSGRAVKINLPAIADKRNR